jgi:hypothetical protein
VEAKGVLVSSSGAMEKNIDVVIGRRFKRQGMSWTKEGANNLLKQEFCVITKMIRRDSLD